MGLMRSGIINRVSSIGVVMKFRIYGVGCLIAMLAGSASQAQIQQGLLWDNAPDPSKPYKLSEDKFSRYYGPKHTYLTSGAPVNPKG